MEIKKKQIDGLECYSIVGDLDINTSIKAKKFIENDIHNGTSIVILEMSGVEFIDSTGIGVIIGIMKNMNNLNGRLILFNLPRPILNLFEKTALLSFFQIAKTTSEITAFLEATDRSKKI